MRCQDFKIRLELFWGITCSGSCVCSTSESITLVQDVPYSLVLESNDHISIWLVTTIGASLSFLNGLHPSFVASVFKTAKFQHTTLLGNNT